MSQSDETIDKVLQLLKEFEPRSVFLYGSRGRGDFTPQSDYEIGAVFNAESYVERSEIHAAINDPDVKVYPFKWDELTSGNLDFLFQKSLYLKELKTGAKMLDGEDVISEIPDVPITVLDLIQRTRFDIGMALAALLSFRSTDMPTSMEEFTKSCLYGARSLVILEKQTFPIGYEAIFDSAKTLITDPDSLNVLNAAIQYRRDGTIPPIDAIYDNISFLDSYLEPRILKVFNERGNLAIL